ncbi:MAG: S8 family serine peptidase [candidate division Zixibacteria bacterium]|nr:S8 family serine peptidase [candidate division Zixibacteria bacterium]
MSDFGRYIRPALLVVSILLTWFVSPVAKAAEASDSLGQDRLDISSAVSDQHRSVLVFLEHDKLGDQLNRAATASKMNRAQRLKAVTRNLESYRPSGVDRVEKFLKEHSTTEVARYWIVPAFTATLSDTEIGDLRVFPGVRDIVPNESVELIAPVEVRAADALATSSSSHVAMLNVPPLWARGITGLGRLVCSFDTGVESNHLALSGNWRGNHASLSACWFSTIAPLSAPYDKADHGTHTMGTMVGVAGSDTIGVAPGAEWITAGVVDQGKSLSATFSDILAAFQWALNPDGDTATTDDVPDVILNSWGVPASMFSPCDETFFTAIDNVEAAGIVCVFSAGNEGPATSSLRNPASRASSPLNAFSVGAVDNAKVIASFSSRGPGGCGYTAIKPEIVAPGINVRSAAKDGGYKLMSGTSMAAPFIAGLVALCRQYNPDATVEEIKWAIINSAQDLGPIGEDNSYGYGLPDASRMLDFLSNPETPRFRLSGYSISGDGIALPGESFDVQITLTRTTGTAENVIARLDADAPGISIPNDSVAYYFGLAGTTSLGDAPFRVQFDQALIHGQKAPLTLRILDEHGRVFDSLHIEVPVGFKPNGAIADLADGKLQFTVSDFGQYGLAPGSIYNVGGRGFSYDGSENLLYEAGIIIGRSQMQLSSSVRAADGSFMPSDFIPEAPLSEELTNADGVAYRTARFADAMADISIPVAITQYSADYAPVGEDGIIIMRYRLVNTSLTTLNDLFFGFFSDFDMPGGSDQTNYDPSLGLLTLNGNSGPMVGIVGLSGLPECRTMSNDSAKSGFTRQQQFELISTPGVVTSGGDIMSAISGGPFRLSPGDSVEVAIALIAGASGQEVTERAIRARELYLAPTDVDHPDGDLPDSYVLYQNYPNPFNPTTTIDFELPVSGNVQLRVFNMLGQTVRELQSGWLTAGTHQVEWDGLSDSGQDVASGVYFYRLTAEKCSRGRKMILLR